ncbi:hypothetical protein NG99_20050 [Erwinia typographi]|uniref:MASE1 domain-containing protein n=1 Tax=Erwinia typographi TaxID=371042 RepID=A0A0A3YQP3_9GAMM|nr:MASE1 domain-containing protein [Erwinia typographi]KGT89127.1 hypothetical protein NG99_20050 [Erwinia typographi]
MVNWRKGMGYWLTFVAIYFVLATISMENRDPWSLSSAVWLPAGLVLGILCTSPRIYWPIWGVSAALLHILVSVLFGRTIDIALTFALVDLAVLFPLAMMWHSVHRYLNHLSYRSETLLLLTGVYFASALGGILSALALLFLDYPVILSHSFTWALSNATGCLSSAPFFIIRRVVKEEKVSFSYAHAAALVSVTLIFFLPSELQRDPLLSQAQLYLVLGISLVLTAWWPLRALSAYFMWLTLVVSLATFYGYGPLATGDQQGVQASQLYLLAVITLGLIVATREKEQLVLNAKIRQQLGLLDNLLTTQQPVFFQLSAGEAELIWLDSTSVFGIPLPQILTLPLFQARIHPQDRENFAACLPTEHAEPASFRKGVFRLMLADCQYHQVRCNLVYAHPQVGTLGILMLYT